MRAVLIICCLLTGLLQGCSFSEYQEKEDARSRAIVNAVMDSESVIPGTKLIDALSTSIAATGKYLKVGKWRCDKNVKDSSYDVWLDFTLNDVPEKLHWVFDAQGVLHPANDLTQKISKRQVLKL